MKNLLWIFLFPASIGLSQSSHYWIKTNIKEVTNPKSGEWKLTLSPGGVVLGDSSGFIVGSPQSSPYRNQNLSAVFISTITDQGLTATASTYDELKAGDLIYLKANLPGNVSYAGILFDLVVNGIIFNDADGKPYYSPAEIFQGNKSGEELVLNRMLVDIRNGKSNNSNVIAAGIHKGKPVKEIVSQTTIATITSFLNYSIRLPQIFSEPNINLAIELERWIQNGSIDMPALDLILTAGGEKLRAIQTESGIRELLIHLTNAASIHYSFNNNPDEQVAALSQLSTPAANFLTGNDLGFFYFNYGSALHSIKKYKESLMQYELSAQAYQTHDPIQYARAISRQAECNEQLSDFQSAINGYNTAADLWKNVIQSTPTPYHYSRLQIVLEGLARCQEELKINHEYITTQIALASVFKKLNLLNNRGNAFWNIGYTYGVKLGDPSTSNQFYEKAYQVFDSIKNVASAVTVICNQAINFRINKDYKKALEMGQRAEAYARANLNDASEAYALENILSTFKAQEKNDKALDVALRLDKLYARLNDGKKLASTKDEVASLYAGLNKNKEAAKAAEEAVKIYETFDKGKDLAYAYWNAGYYLDATRWQESNAYYEKAFEYFKDTSAKNATTLLSNIAINYREINDSAKSFPLHKKAVDFAQSRNDTASLIYAHEKFYYTYAHFLDYKGMGREAMQVALLNHDQNNSDKANEYYDKVLAAMDSLINQYAIEKNYKLQSQTYLAKHDIYRIQGNAAGQAEMLYYAGSYIQFSNEQDAIRKCLNYFKQSLNIYKTIEDRYNAVTYVENQIAKVYQTGRMLDSALYYINLAIELGEEKNYWTNLKDSYQLKAESLSELKQYDGVDGAIACYQKAIKSYGETGDMEGQIECKKKLADLFNQLAKYSDAAKIHLERLNAIDKKDELKLADVHWNYSYSLSFIPSRIKESNDNYWKAAALFKKNKSISNYVTVVSNVAYNFRDAGDSVNAFNVMGDLLKEVKKPSSDPNYESYVLALEKAGHIYKHFERHKQALLVRKESAEGYEALGNLEKAFTLFEDAGKSAESCFQFELADQLFKKSYSAAINLDDKKKMAGALWNIAYNQGAHQLKNKEAIALYEEAYIKYLEAGDTANASVMRSNVAQNYWKLLDFDKAILHHNKAIEIATEGKYFSQVVFSWRKLADLYKETNNPTQQAFAINNAIATLEVLRDTTELITSYFEIGSSYSEAQEVTLAEDYFKKALSMAKAKKDTINIAWANYKFAGLYHGRKPDLAKEHYVITIDLQRKLNDKTNLVYSLASQGSLIMESDRPQSEKLLQEALNLANEIKDDYVIAYCHGRLYDLYRSFGKPGLAHQHIDISNNLYKKLNEKNSLANNYILLANEYLYDYGDFNKSQQYMAEAKVLLDSVNNPFSHANFHGQQCNVFDDQGQYDLALAELDKARDIYKSLKNDWGLAGVYIDYGNIYKVLSEYELALKYQRMSDSLYQTLNLQYQRLAPIANMGDIYFEQGDYPRALDYFKRSLKYMEDNKDQNTNLCKMYSAIGLTNSYMTNYAEAENWLMKGLETSKRVNATRTGADILNYLGKLKIETKKYDEAEKFLLEAKTFLLNQNLMIERTSNATHLGHLYVKKGELEKAKQELTEAIGLAEKFGKDAVLWEAYFRMGDYYRKSGNLQEAKNYLMKSVKVIDELRNHIVGGEEAKKLFSSDKWILEAYEELISVLLELGETEEAMAWLQKINENNVKDKIRSMDVTFEDEEKNKTLAREKELKMKLEVMEKQINAQKQSKNVDAQQIKRLESIKNIAEGDYLKFVNQTVNVQPELSKYFSNTVQPSQLKGKKKQIPKDMALVSYLVGEKQLYIFVATSDTVVARIVSVAKEKIHRDVNAITNVTKNHLGSFGVIDLQNQEQERSELVTQLKQSDPTLKPFEEAYSYLVSPIGELLVSKTRLGIIPTGELNYIPFQLLGKTLKNGKFSLLINQFSMFYTNSTDMLLRGADAGKTMNILAFGNPDKTLPATEKEVNEIKRIFPSAQVYIRDEATEDRAKYASEEFNVMHFATHGSLDYEDFSKSYLTMAGNAAKNEDGMLTLEELWGMDVMSHLNIVVLSACQTAVTKGSDESSPVSPASGFLQNGVKSVVASLWKVDDEATSILMNDFYKNIKTMDAVDAMRLAQSNLSNIPKFNHPYYWAAMVLIGDWR